MIWRTYIYGNRRKQVKCIDMVSEDWIDRWYRNDIVMLCEYVALKPSGKAILPYVRFIMKRQHPFMYHQRNKYIIVLGVVRQCRYLCNEYGTDGLY